MICQAICNSMLVFFILHKYNEREIQEETIHEHGSGIKNEIKKHRP